MEHATSEARALYLKEHPNADPKNHSVNKGTSDSGKKLKLKDPDEVMSDLGDLSFPTQSGKKENYSSNLKSELSHALKDPGKFMREVSFTKKDNEDSLRNKNIPPEIKTQAQDLRKKVQTKLEKAGIEKEVAEGLGHQAMGLALSNYLDAKTPEKSKVVRNRAKRNKERYKRALLAYRILRCARLLEG